MARILEIDYHTKAAWNLGSPSETDGGIARLIEYWAEQYHQVGHRYDLSYCRAGSLELHGLEAHIVMQMLKIDGGNSRMIEHWVEQYHQVGHRYDLNYCQVGSLKEQAAVPVEDLKAIMLKIT